MKRLSGAAVLGLCALSVRPGLANDTSVGGTGVDLVSLRESQVKMLSEDIEITAREPYWEVVARYRFENPSAADVPLQVGFPEVGCPMEEGSDCHAQAFVGLSTTVDGKKVEHRRGSLKETEKWADHLGTFWLFDVNFRGQQVTEIEHRYRMDQSMDVMGTRSGVYVTRTGSTWATPIASATFHLRLPANTISIVASDTLRVASQGGQPSLPQWRLSDDGAFFQLDFHEADFQPEADFWFGYTTTSASLDFVRFAPEQLSERARSLGIDPKSLCPGRPDAQGPGLSPEQAQMCMNQVYAGWGYPFQKKSLAALFYGEARDWHVEEGFAPLTLARDPVARAEFSAQWLSPGDQQLLRALSELGQLAPKGETVAPPPRLAAPPSAAVAALGSDQAATSRAAPADSSTPQAPASAEPAVQDAAVSSSSGARLGLLGIAVVALLGLAAALFFARGSKS